MGREITYIKAINEALQQAMKEKSEVIFFGLGADDPRRQFGSSEGLVEAFGSDRVFDMPTSENGMTGVAVGAAIHGLRPIMTHLRLDFFLLAMDQLVNSAAKWHYMFGGKDSVPIVIRLILGRGWGQGPTHSQSLQSWFAHIPGLKVVMPTTPGDAKGLLLSSIDDLNPVLFLEHRWLHHQVGVVNEEPKRIPLGMANRIREGSDVTIVGYSYMTVEALRAARHLEASGISCEVIDLRTIQPLDWQTVRNSVRKTGRILALDTGAESFSIASEIVAKMSIEEFGSLKTSPKRLGSPDFPVPTSVALTAQFYPTAFEICEAISKMMNRNVEAENLRISKTPHDVPGEWFRGPF